MGRKALFSTHEPAVYSKEEEHFRPANNLSTKASSFGSQLNLICLVNPHNLGLNPFYIVVAAANLASLEASPNQIDVRRLGQSYQNRLFI